ncbi:TRAF-interacting protein with FHA domain-containing protein A [Engraulis encrasicolus]|uniref:TRAF-interacting protein with FHA domain-containing protein A n=1 Tax=Engraulis encrasicolus TaxID=184585 RepID=UPI002FD4BE2C
MAVCQSSETDELLTCLRVQLYHPEPHSLFANLPMNQRLRREAEDPLRLGRTAGACEFILNDNRVSRKQLSLQAFRRPGSTEMRFNVQNLSRRKPGLQVNGIDVGYLNIAELPDKALVRFGRYELLILREVGDCESHFEVLFEWRGVPPSQEMGLGAADRVAVMESGVAALALSPPATPGGDDPSTLRVMDVPRSNNVPSESDENFLTCTGHTKN